MVGINQKVFFFQLVKAFCKLEVLFSSVWEGCVLQGDITNDYIVESTYIKFICEIILESVSHNYLPTLILIELG